MAGAQLPRSKTGSSLASPEEYPAMSSRSEKPPVWASVDRVQVGVLLPKPPGNQHCGKSGAPAVSSEGFATAVLPVAGGPETGGLTVPPMTSLTVLTVVVLGRDASQVTKLENRVGEMERLSHPEPEQM